MFARVTTVAASPDAIERGVEDFRRNVLPFVRESGGKGALMLVDQQTGRGLGISLWETEEAMQASEEKANQLRSAVADTIGVVEQPTVDRYEVAVFETV